MFSSFQYEITNMVTKEDIVVTKVRPKEKSKQELYFFQENVHLDDICSTKQNLCTLVIIGQPQLTSLSGLSKLIHLQELWVVECKIKDISCLNECTKLEKLYVYSNKIELIPNLSKASRLAIISLSGNDIRCVANVGKLEHLKELNLADNKLKRLPNVFNKSSNLKYVNLAGNRLHRMKDVNNLRALRKLESIVFDDPIYGECPLTRLCNYRSYVIYWLPQINKLDHYPIENGERRWIHGFFKRKVMRYNVLLHNGMNDYLKTLKELCKERRERNKRFKRLLKHSRILELREEVNDESAPSVYNALSLIELDEERSKEREEMASLRLEITYQQLKSHMHHCGNLYLREYTCSTNSTMSLCRIILEESLCPRANSATGITGVRLHRVTKVLHKETKEFRIWNDKNDTSRKMNKSFKLLADTLPNGRRGCIQDWPLSVLESGFYNQRRISLTNCLAIADTPFYEAFSKREKTINDYCEKRRTCVLLQVPFIHCASMERCNDRFHGARHRDKDDRFCQKYVSTGAYLSDTVLVVEYEYVFQNDSSEENICEIDPISPPSLIERVTIREISSFLQRDEVDIKILTSISLVGQGIRNLDDSWDLPNLMELDLSYNRLDLFPNPQIISNVKKLNLSFNNIRWIRLNGSLLTLENLDISWNRLVKCMKSLQTLRTFAPNLKGLNMDKNPFFDIVSREKVILLTRVYFPKAKSISFGLTDDDDDDDNGDGGDDGDGYGDGDEIFEKSTICPLDQRKDAWSIDFEIFEETNEKERSTSNVDGRIFDKRKKHVHLPCRDSSTELDRSQKLFNATTICATHCPIMRLQSKKPLIHLTRLNLSDNCIIGVDALTEENFPKLRYLDLTNNLIASLKPMGSSNTILEFYCSHNEIRRLQEIDNLKNWHRLRIIDLSYNPMESEMMSYKDFLIFHLINLKYVSGESVDTLSVAQAKSVFRNVLDKSMLLSMSPVPKLTNVKQLDIVKCSIKNINLPSTMLVHLESLDLSRNHITSLQNLNAFPRLKTLRLSYNRLEVLDMDQFKDIDSFSNLCILHLDHNRIDSVIWSDNSHVFPVLKHLFLHHNRLRNVDGLRRNLTLETLIMDHNKVETVNANCFHEDNNITCLSLESNKIQDLRFIKRLSSLKKLFIANNRITNEDELETLNSLNHLEELTLVGNPLCKTMNCYKFGLCNFAKIKIMDGYRLVAMKCEVNHSSCNIVADQFD